MIIFTPCFLCAQDPSAPAHGPEHAPAPYPELEMGQQQQQYYNGASPAVEYTQPVYFNQPGAPAPAQLPAKTAWD